MGNAPPYLGGSVICLSKLSKREAGIVCGLAQAVHEQDSLAGGSADDRAVGSGSWFAPFGRFAFKGRLPNIGRDNVGTYGFGRGATAPKAARNGKRSRMHYPIDCLELAQDGSLDSGRLSLKGGLWLMTAEMCNRGKGAFRRS